MSFGSCSFSLKRYPAHGSFGGHDPDAVLAAGDAGGSEARTITEYAALISQIATSKSGRGGRRKLPWAFTEHGAIQAANVLNSKLAVQMGVYVVRAFVQLQDLLASNKELARRVNELEARLEKMLTTHDEAIVGILKAIRELTNPPAPRRRGNRIHGRSRR